MSTFYENEDVLAPNLPQITNGRLYFLFLLCLFVDEYSCFFFFVLQPFIFLFFMVDYF